MVAAMLPIQKNRISFYLLQSLRVIVLHHRQVDFLLGCNAVPLEVVLRFIGLELRNEDDAALEGLEGVARFGRWEYQIVYNRVHLK